MIKAQDLIDKFWLSYNENWGYIYGMKHVVWSQARQDNYVKAYSGDSDRAMSCKYGAKWIGHIVTDCSGLFAWWFEQLGGAIAHGSNSIWDRYCSDKGTLKAGKKSNGSELKPGTAVLTTKDGRHNHIGLYVGGDTVIEAKGAQYGVTTSKLTDKRWTAWGELKGVEYGAAPAEETPPWEEPAKEDKVDRPTIRKGSKGDAVKEMQQLLMDRGYNLGKWGADGDFGSATEAAVKAFQKDNGLTADGICGPKTWAKLLQGGTVNDPMKDPTYRVIINGLDLAQARALCNNYPGSKMEEE